MADDQQKSRQPKENLETIPPGAESVKADAALERLRLRMKMEKAERPGKEILLDHKESPLKQEVELVRLSAGSKVMIYKALEKKIITQEELAQAGNFSWLIEKLSRQEVMAALDRDDLPVLKKLIEINSPASSLHSFWLTTWPIIMGEAAQFKNGLPEEEKEGWTGKMKDFYGKNKLVCNLTGLALLAGGAYLLFRKKSKDENELKNNVGTTWGVGMGVVAGLGLGAYFGWDYIKKWFEKTLGMTPKEAGDKAKELADAAADAKNKVDKFQNTRKTEGLAAAAAEALGNLEVKTEHEKAAEHCKAYYDVQISKQAFALAGKEKYKEFRKATLEGRIETIVTNLTANIKDPAKLAEAKTYLATELSVMNRVFQTLEDDRVIDIDEEKMSDETTVDQVLLLLLADKTARKINRDTIDVVKEAGQQMSETYSAVINDFLENTEVMADTFGNGAIRQTVEGWKGVIKKGEFKTGDVYNMPANIIGACAENGIALAISAGVVMAYTGGKWLLLSRMLPFTRAASELVSTGWSPGNWKFEEALKVYGISASPFIVYGMAKGLWVGEGAGGKLLKAAQGMLGEAVLGPAKIPFQAVSLASDMVYAKNEWRSYLNSWGKRAPTFVKHEIGGRAVQRLQNNFLVGRLIDQESANAWRRKIVAERIVALEGKQGLYQKQMGRKSMKALQKHEAELAEEIKGLKKEFGQLLGKTVTGSEVPHEVEAAVQEARMEIFKKTYQKMPEARRMLIEANPKLAEMYLVEGKGHPLVRKLELLKDPAPVMEWLKAQPDVLDKLNRNPRTVRSKNFSEFLKLSEAAGEKGKAFYELLAKDPALGELITDPAVLKNRHFLRDLQAGLQNGAFETAEGLNAEAIRIQAEAAKEAGMYRKFKKALTEGASRNFRKAAEQAKVPLKKAARGIEKAKVWTAEQIRSAEAAIAKHPKLEAAWRQYKEVMQKSGNVIRAFNGAEFLQWRVLWTQAERLGGIAFVAALAHGLSSAENKPDYLAKTAAELGAFGAGFKGGTWAGAKLGAKIPGPGVAKLACIAAGAVMGITLSGAAGAGYEYLERTALDRWAPNRGQGGAWETLAAGAETLFGGGMNNAIQLLDHFDTSVTNVEEDELFGEDNAVNAFYYQQYLQATAPVIDTGGLRKEYFRDTGKFNHELRQLSEHLRKDTKELERQKTALDESAESMDDREYDEKLSALEDQIALKEERVRIIEEELMIGSPGWRVSQELYHAKAKQELDALKQEYASRFSERIGEQKEAAEFLENLEQRLLSGHGDLVRTEREDELWVRLRDQSAKITVNGGEVERSFPKWFQNLKKYCQSYTVYTHARDYGKIQSNKLTPKSQAKEVSRNLAGAGFKPKPQS